MQLAKIEIDNLRISNCVSETEIQNLFGGEHSEVL